MLKALFTHWTHLHDKIDPEHCSRSSIRFCLRRHRSSKPNLPHLGQCVLALDAQPVLYSIRVADAAIQGYLHYFECARQAERALLAWLEDRVWNVVVVVIWGLALEVDRYTSGPRLRSRGMVAYECPCCGYWGTGDAGVKWLIVACVGACVDWSRGLVFVVKVLGTGWRGLTKLTFNGVVRVEDLARDAHDVC
jgi:hypothetical protein